MIKRTVLSVLFCCLCYSLSASAQVGQLLHPAAGAIGQYLPVGFDWIDASSNIWLLEVSEDESFTSPAISEVLYSSSYTTSDLDSYKIYFWRVRYGLDIQGNITWDGYTPANSFRTGSCCLKRGDINSSGSIDVSDLTFLVDYLFAGGASPTCDDNGVYTEADVNGSGSVDVSDLTYIVDYLFAGGPSPADCPFLIKIVNLQPNDDVVYGIADVIDTATYKVVLWAKTNQWYVQPSVAEPYTYIQNNGLWSNSTYPWDRMLALMVDSTYVPGATRNYHPSLDPGVIGWDEYPWPSIRYINWSGYRWLVKKGDLVGPGPNYFSDDSANVWIDQQSRLHLKIDYRDAKWYCAEVTLDHLLGYGLYTFKVDSRIDSLDYNTIFSGFLYETIDKEFDIEWSQRLANPFNAQYVVQPWYTSGNIVFFHMPTGSQTSHSFEWRSDRIVFNSWNGHADTPTTSTLISTWTYTGDDIPIPNDDRMIFNLHLFGGDAPAQGIGDEVIITSFEYAD